MPREMVRLTPLSVRKHLLIAESDLNRARLVEDATAFSVGVKAATTRVLSVGSIVSSAVVLMASLAALRRPWSPVPSAKPSFLQAMLKRMRFLSSVWLAFRSPDRSKVD